MAGFLLEFKSEINEIEGVYQIKIDVPFDVKYVCTYLLKVDGRYVLIDAGFNFGNWDKLFFSALEDLNVDINEIDYCIISHDHLDHIGLMKKLKRKNPNIRIVMHYITYETLKWESDDANIDQIEKLSKEAADEVIKFGFSEEQGKKIFQFFASFRKFRTYCEPDDIVQDNDEINFNSNKLKVIWTPGHALGHICIFDTNKRFLFSGDHILSEITPHIGNFLRTPSINEKYKEFDFNNILDLYLKSLDRIDKLNPKIIFPAHQKIIYNSHERISEIKKHHENRLQEISSLIKNDPMTPLKISQIHFGENLDEMNRYLAFSEVLGHLVYLEHQGRVTRIERDGKILFTS